jgi:hypothetical protein
MRKWGPIAILLALPAWAYVAHVDNAFRNGPFGSEYGSMAMQPPPLVTAVRLLAMLLTLSGLFLSAFDLVRWAKRRGA